MLPLPAASFSASISLGLARLSGVVYSSFVAGSPQQMSCVDAV